MSRQEVFPFEISCRVRSYSHRLNEKAFSRLLSGMGGFFVSEIREDSFKLTCVNLDENCKSISHFVELGHQYILYLLMALNIASLGHFIWDWQTFIPRLYEIKGWGKNQNHNILSLKQKTKEEDGINDITDITGEEILRALLLFPIIVREKASTIRNEYIKGILHLGFSFFDIGFYREAFGNFYRSFENIVTKKVLKLRNLSNEQKQMQGVINEYLCSKIAEDFSTLYRLRSNQIMHAQKDQKKIKYDDVIKMKVIVDGILNRLYQPIWEKKAKKSRESPP